MNKIEFNGKEIIDIDEVKQAIEDTNENTESLKTKVDSTTVKKIAVVNDYPAVEEPNVLYIKLEN